MASKTLAAWLLLGAIFLAAADETLRFTLAVVYQGSDRTVQAIDYSRRTVRLHSGDQLRIRFQPGSPCWLYVYLLDARQELYLLCLQAFPQPDRGFTLPEGDAWYRLDESGGVELFYLIVSNYRLRRLEALTDRAAPRPGQRHPRLQPKRPVLDEIRKLIRESSSLAEAVQKPVTVAGEFRGITEEGEYQGINVETGSLYVRTIRLEH